MKKNRVFFLCGLTALCVLAGCTRTDEKQKTEVTATPAATPTEALPTTSPVQEDEEQSYEVTVSFREEVDEEKDDAFVYFTSSIYYPFFEGTYAENLNQFVSSVTEEFRAALPTAKENAALDYADAKSGNFPNLIFPEVEEFMVSCLWAKEQINVFYCKWFSDIGGVHPNTLCRAYVVDMTTGTTVDIENFLGAYGLTKEELVTYVAEKIQKEHGEELYLFDEESFLEEEVRRFTEENQWFADENGITVFANPYDIASYAYGMIECEISYEDLEEGLKK